MERLKAFQLEQSHGKNSEPFARTLPLGTGRRRMDSTITPVLLSLIALCHFPEPLVAHSISSPMLIFSSLSPEGIKHGRKESQPITSPDPKKLLVASLSFHSITKQFTLIASICLSCSRWMAWFSFLPKH